MVQEVRNSGGMLRKIGRPFLEYQTWHFKYWTLHGDRRHAGKQRVDICSLQETRWKSNGVSHWALQVVLKWLKDSPKWSGNLHMGITDTKCTGDAKSDFWNTLSDTVRKTPSSEIPLICGDLNGHVGGKANGFHGVHGGFGYGFQNEDVIRILEFAESHELFLLNTYFKKKQNI
ncbi:hypothetical protein HELRODRAFT_173209 [Helobdella robusta]|uniref:Endonuclease/exonuclease/phosphatase domain-containing protein n=1 Tax=Helobdella robusta TaxID=6412 RepID=T1F6K6_HELRO|nr:hypothetical protein HELRODRAFT_173209 [Helobdella robusta]ESO04121.1 hypothetical protein HELRODRAFT_173209 [Helobdella robusta]